MNKYKIVFKVDDTNFIEVLIPYQEQDLEGCEQTTLIFHHHKKHYIVSQYDFIGNTTEVLHNVLEQALNNQFQLHSSIIKDIGYLTNEYFHDSDKELFISSTQSKNWIGMNYLIGSSQEIGIWIYNKDSAIFLEVAPLYKWHYVDPKKGENYIPYEEFINNYKPHFILGLSRDTAQQWLNKTKELLAIMKQNYKKHEQLAQDSTNLV